MMPLKSWSANFDSVISSYNSRAWVPDWQW